MADIYLDANATTPALPEVADAVHEALTTGFANASSAHRRGGSGRDARERARKQVAELIGAEPVHVVFTSGGTEANNAVLAAAAAEGRHIVANAGEHASVLAPIEHYGIAHSLLPLAPTGRLDPADLDRALADAGPALVAVHLVNSETGIVQPAADLVAVAHRHGARVLVDAAQAVGRLAIDMDELGADYLSFSGHKLHGPPGTGALVLGHGAPPPVLIAGGGQERDRRSGTENLPGLVGLGIACARRHENFDVARTELRTLRDRFEQKLTAALDNVAVNGNASRVVNTSNLRFTGVDGQALMAQLDAAGIQCSHTSACSSRKPEPSATLLAMGLNEDEAFSSLRFSFSILNTADEVDHAVDRIVTIVERLRALC